MVIGLGVNSCICLCLMSVLVFLIFLFSLVFYANWPRVLVTSESSDPVGCLCQGFGNLGLTSSKAKSFFIVVGHNMKPREGMQTGVVGGL